MATTTSPTHALAGPALDNRRIAAALIDLAAPLLAAVALIVTGLLTPAVALVLFGWTLYYFFALESAGGQTVGKRAMNLKVISADDGGEPTLQQYAMRTLARVIDTFGIGLLVMLGTGDKRQRLGDIAARTSVVDADGADAAGADAFDAAHLHARTSAPEPAAAPEPEAKPKRSRPGLGGPELKMPSFGRSKAPKAPKAPKEPKPVKAAKVKSGRPSLGGPELKMPSFGRSKAPKAPKEPKPAKEKKGRPSLGGPELKMPSFGRKKNQIVMPEPAAPEPEQHVPEPEAPVMPEPVAQEPPAQPPVPEVKPFDPFAADAPEPSVEVVGHGEPEPEPEAPEPPAPEIMEREVPDVEIVRDDPPAEPPAPEPMRPSIPAVPPPPADEPLPAAAEHEPDRQPEPEPEVDPEPQHVDGVRDDGSSRVHVKPIETVSAMELLMREAEEQDQHSR